MVALNGNSGFGVFIGNSGFGVFISASLAGPSHSIHGQDNPPVVSAKHVPLPSPRGVGRFLDLRRHVDAHAQMWLHSQNLVPFPLDPLETRESSLSGV